MIREQKELVERENSDPDCFDRDTGKTATDDARNANDIGENEILVVSFGTSFKDGRVQDIKGIEDALQEAYPDWSVRRAFTAQGIINRVQTCDGKKIDNMTQALQRAAANGVKNLVVQPTHLIHGVEYNEIMATLVQYKDRFERAAVAEPLLGAGNSEITPVDTDKLAVAEAVAAQAAADAGYESVQAAAADGAAFVFLGHGTANEAKVSYAQMQIRLVELGFENVYIGTIKDGAEETTCEEIIRRVKEKGYTKVILRPLMAAAGGHANNDMAGDNERSWKSRLSAAGLTAEAQISGLGRIKAVQDLYVAHTAAAIRVLNRHFHGRP